MRSAVVPLAVLLLALMFVLGVKGQSGEAVPAPTRQTGVHTHTTHNDKISTTVTHFPAVKKDSQWAGVNEDVLVLLTKDGLVYYSRTNGKEWKMVSLPTVVVDRIDCIRNTSRVMLFASSVAHGSMSYVYDFDAGDAVHVVEASFGRHQTMPGWLTPTTTGGKLASKGLTFDSISPNPVDPSLALARTVDPSCKYYPSRASCHMFLFVTGFDGLESYKVWRQITMYDDFWFSAEWSTGKHHHYDQHEIFAVRRADVSGDILSSAMGNLIKMSTSNSDTLFTAVDPAKHHYSYTLLHNAVMVKREGDYMFVLTLTPSVKKGSADTKIAFDLHVSKNDLWYSTVAKFPSVHVDGSPITGTHLGYDVVDVQDEIFVNVYNNHLQKGLFSRRWGTTYVSGMNGHRYTVSLEYNRRHINRKESDVGSATDFHRVGALEGVIIANKLLNPDNEKCIDCPSQEVCDSECSFGTVLSRDNGKTWQRITAPPGYCSGSGRSLEKADGDEDAEDRRQSIADASCSLHLHGATSADGDLSVDIKPLMSSRTAPGLIIGSGNVGSELGTVTRSIFMSRDGGESWVTLSSGRHLYGEANYGSMLYLIKHTADSGLLNYTTNSGQSWHTTTFLTEQTGETFRWSDLVEVPHQPSSRSFTMFGVEQQSGNLVSAHVEFKETLMQSCSASCAVSPSEERCATVANYVGDASSQFEFFTPASFSSELSVTKCLMGRTVQYARLKVGQSCWQSSRSVVTGALSPNTQQIFLGLAAPATTTPCACTYDDYECDYLYHESTQKDGNEGFTCVSLYKNPNGNLLSACEWYDSNGWYMASHGYRKIAGDGCKGGKESELSPKNTTCPLNPAPAQPPKQSDKNWSGFAKFIVFCVVVGSLAGAVFIGYRRNDAVRDIVDQITTAAASMMPKGGVSSQYRTVSANDDDGGNSDDDNDVAERGTLVSRAAADTTGSVTTTGNTPSNIVQAATALDSPRVSDEAPQETVVVVDPLGVVPSRSAVAANTTAPTDLIDIFE